MQFSASFADLLRFSPIFADFRRFSPIFADFCRFLPIFGEFSQFSERFANIRQKIGLFILKHNVVKNFSDQIHTYVAIICVKIAIFSATLNHNTVPCPY
jgi:hypothetical protein